MLFPGNSRWNKYLAGPSDRSSNEMTVRRSRYSSVPPGYFASTKGHSALRKWSYAPTSRASLYEDTYIPEVIRPRSYYDTSREENEIRRGVNDELIYTSNLMDDTYDLASKSRNRDQILLRDATRALVDTETYASPRSSVTSNRLRATSVVNRPAPLTSRAVSCPPTSRRSNQPLYGGKSHWDEEGKVTKPKNLMSWKYRIESRVPPGDYFFPIKTIGHVRDKLLHVKEQMDRHKQLMDRYLPDEDSQTDVKTKIMNMYVDMEQHNPYLFRGREGLITTKSCENSPPSSILRSPTPRRAAPTATIKPSDGYQPMSDVRRRVRRVICKNRGNPRFFKTD
ncbi:uncharacterized protein LOC127702959 isoform X13 [Mytilus californianus]|uniref:uncharacterized protein LOC127702959 isoform X13 n=1 Tax=Mytilus californianus TaxID=6549 RepID=UPI0022472B0F|nr:uncharacterized protein LOC127702959 isoform X13 [Mytilus californianus]